MLHYLKQPKCVFERKRRESLAINVSNFMTNFLHQIWSYISKNVLEIKKREENKAIYKLNLEIAKEETLSSNEDVWGSEDAITNQRSTTVPEYGKLRMRLRDHQSNYSFRQTRY